MPFVIDVDPAAFSFLGIHVRWYGIIVAAAAAVALWIAMREARRRCIAPEAISAAAIWVGVAALIGGRALYVAQNDLARLAADPVHLFAIWDGGLSFYGALLAAVVALILVARRRGMALLPLLDIAAPAAAIGQAVGHPSRTGAAGTQRAQSAATRPRWLASREASPGSSRSRMMVAPRSPTVLTSRQRAPALLTRFSAPPQVAPIR